MASRLPWGKWFYRDWMTDPNLSMCSPQTRGVWVDLISSMMGNSEITGVLSGTSTQLARIARCTESEMESALDELKDTGTADVTCHADSVTDHTVFTVMSRRMSREHSEREKARIRKRKQRKRELKNEMSRGNHKPVTGEKSEVRSQSQNKAGSVPNGTAPSARPPDKRFEAIREALKSSCVPYVREDVVALLGELKRWDSGMGVSTSLDAFCASIESCDLEGKDEWKAYLLKSLRERRSRRDWWPKKKSSRRELAHDNPGWNPRVAAQLEEMDRISREDAEQVAMQIMR